MHLHLAPECPQNHEENSKLHNFSNARYSFAQFYSGYKLCRSKIAQSKVIV